MPTTHDWTTKGAVGETIYGTTHEPDREPIAHLVIGHGLKGYKDYGLLPRLAEAAAERGLTAHRFNFSHSGMTTNIDTFERPDLFEKDTWQKQIVDLNNVIAEIRDGGLPGGPTKPIVVFGHSRGGVTALLTCTRIDPPVAAVITASAPHQACNLSEDDREKLKRDGKLAMPSSRTGQTLYVGLPWLIEQEAHPEAHDPMLAAKRLPCPLLIVHGEADETVETVSASALHDATEHRARLVILPGASHTFDCPNPPPPADELPEATRSLIDTTIRFAAQAVQA
jgi:alpha-beta hydrolase superfamily lysophospholipase